MQYVEWTYSYNICTCSSIPIKQTLPWAGRQCFTLSPDDVVLFSYQSSSIFLRPGLICCRRGVPYLLWPFKYGQILLFAVYLPNLRWNLYLISPQTVARSAVWGAEGGDHGDGGIVGNVGDDDDGCEVVCYDLSWWWLTCPPRPALQQPPRQSILFWQEEFWEIFLIYVQDISELFHSGYCSCLEIVFIF